ncbi:MAG: HesA/MoeB/ThiF family protein [Kiritimatiellae bacterium]|nr:HesA/MoeB/ThiF family protein [Kiritimatiellia bacterium]MDD5522418.1 HesA/MoeB/ThiF family protein [Kiritimatiellia bacterium]
MKNNSRLIERYSRHISLPEIGLKGQRKLMSAKVLVIGAGGLGSPACLYLAAAGVGTIGIVDDDRVDLSNLQRQIVHSTSDVGHNKTYSASRKLKALNPGVNIRKYNQRLNVSNSVKIIRDYDFVIDATDNFESKFLIADICHKTGTPYSHGGVFRFIGQTITVIPGKTACYRCIFEQPPKETDSSFPQGPLGTVPGVIGTIQATEAIKHILGIGNLLTNRMLVYDALEMSFRIINTKQNQFCPLCGKRKKEKIK